MPSNVVEDELLKVAHRIAALDDEWRSGELTGAQYSSRLYRDLRESTFIKMCRALLSLHARCQDGRSSSISTPNPMAPDMDEADKCFRDDAKDPYERGKAAT